MEFLRARLVIAVVVGALAALVCAQVAGLEPLGWVARLLVGYIAAALALAVPILLTYMRLDPTATRRAVQGADPGAVLTDFVSNAAALMSLLGVGLLIVGGSTNAPFAQQLTAAIIAFAVVAVGWVCINTLYALRYTRLFYADDVQDIDFNMSHDPAFTDFAYFSFNLGMTYQVSDTSTQSTRVRQVVLGHCVLSWVYGAVIIASVINLVVGLG